MGGGGNDTANYAGSAAGVTVSLAGGTASGGDAAGDSLSDIENIIGSGQADRLTGDAGNNTLSGGGGDDLLLGGDGLDELLGGLGDDTLNGGAGADVLNGGDGIDTADYSATSNAVTINLSNGTGLGGEAQGDTLISIERVVGSSGDDMLRGDQSGNIFVGGSGNDLFRGAAGVDSYTGGAGNDTYTFLMKDVLVGGVHQGVDVISDFNTGDTLDLRDFVKSYVPTLENSIRMTSTVEGTMVSANVDGQFVDIVMLSGVRGGDADAWASDYMLMA